MTDEINRRIRTLLPMACDGVGPSQTCLDIARGMQAAGADIDVFVNRISVPKGRLPVKSLLSGPFSRIPYPWTKGILTRILEEWYLHNTRETDVAYLWPGTSIRVHREIHRRSIPIVLEGINTRMKHAKSVLDAAYEELGATPAHNITEQRIQEEEEQLSLATSILAPSPAVESALRGHPIASRVISSSYGTHVPSRLPPLASSRRQSEVVFLFCGYACVRKGIHHLLTVWPRMPSTARLRIVGRIEPLIAEKFSRVLSSGQVELTGFVNDVAAEYAAADVFVLPSLEEGDPLVTYEAAVRGLPLLVSAMGAGRLVHASWVIEPSNQDELLHALSAVHLSRCLRQKLGERAQAAVTAHDWTVVGEKRLRGISQLLSREYVAGINK